MRKKIQFTVLLSFIVGICFSQDDVSIVAVDDMSSSLNGTTLEVSGDPSDINIYKDLRIVNNGNEAITISYKRTRLVDAGILDQICDEFLCHDADDNDTYVTPIEVTVEAGENTEFKPQIVPDGKEVCVYNKYEVITREGVVFGEITIKYTSGNANCYLNTSNLDKKSPINVFPNPTSDYITVANAEKGSTIQIIDILGKKMVTEQINSEEQKVNVSHLPGGIYFYSITLSDGTQLSSKKLVVKH